MSGCGSRYKKSWSASSLIVSPSLLTIVVSGNFFSLVLGSIWGDAWLRSVGGTYLIQCKYLPSSENDLLEGHHYIHESQQTQ